MKIDKRKIVIGINAFLYVSYLVLPSIIAAYAALETTEDFCDDNTDLCKPEQYQPVWGGEGLGLIETEKEQMSVALPVFGFISVVLMVFTLVLFGMPK